MTDAQTETFRRSIALRFGDGPIPNLPPQGRHTLARMAAHTSCRSFRSEGVDQAILELLCAVALASPTKSDLQQRDIIIIRDSDLRTRLNALTEQDWVAQAPSFLIFCGNNRRQRQIHKWRRHPFVNDHLDAFFNTAVDAGIALSAFVTAAEAIGLGCCPVSTVRNYAAAVSDLLGLPEHVYPVAGLALGWPEAPDAEPAMRLPLRATVHVDRFSEHDLRDQVETYDQQRSERQPYAKRRGVDAFGDPSGPYTWSEDKSRQYARPERADFGRFVRDRGFSLE